MYIPKHFEITDQQEKFAFIESNAFGQFISTVDGRPFATHMPFYLSADKTKLIGHFAKQNPQHKDLQNPEVLVTLQGAARLHFTLVVLVSRRAYVELSGDAHLREMRRVRRC
ncbi:MAG: FMN-binding negative transcriptional regulator [Candidatus Hydrogenedentota bacterium]